MNSTHPLAVWLDQHEVRRKEFAAAIGVSAPYLSNIIAGRCRPSLQLLDRITAHTGREITAAHFQREESV